MKIKSLCCLGIILLSSTRICAEYEQLGIFTNDEVKDTWKMVGEAIVQSTPNSDIAPWGDNVIYTGEFDTRFTQSGMATISTDIMFLDYAGKELVWGGLVLFFDPDDPANKIAPHSLGSNKS